MTNVSIAHLIHRASQRADAIVKSQPKAGYSPRGNTILTTLLQLHHQNVICTQMQLVGMTGVDRSTLNTILAGMKAKSLVSMKIDKDDRRARRVSLTAKGRQLAASIPTISDDADAELLALLPFKQRAPFVQALRILTNPNRKPAEGHAGLALAAE
tara:strand:- start:3184 stop:3651 length:468 start_codon:yes stop_codon:yes gene_type:complete